jgi:predicted cobalt transporter CbtA
VPIHTTPQ